MRLQFEWPVNKTNVHYWVQNNPYGNICNPGDCLRVHVLLEGYVLTSDSRQTMNEEQYRDTR